MRHPLGPVAISLLALLGPLMAEDGPAPTQAPATAPAASAPVTGAATTLVGSITALAPTTHSLSVRPKTGDAIVVTTDDKTVVTIDGDAATYGDLKMDQKVTVVREGERVIAVAAVSTPDGKAPPKPKKKKKGE